MVEHSLLCNIIQEFGPEVGEKIKKMTYESNLFMDIQYFWLKIPFVNTRFTSVNFKYLVENAVSTDF